MLSKLFGKKEPEPKMKFHPENRLEALLMQAAVKASLRPEFYKELLAADLYVLILPQENQSGKFTTQPGDTISVKGSVFNGKQLIPIFSSERRLREYITGQDTLAKLNGQSLFAMFAAQNQGVILNPGSGYGKEFTAQEIAGLADGSIFQINKQLIEKDTQILLGAPAEPPTELIQNLIAYFEREPRVKRAYYAQIHMPQSDEAPHLIFAIEADGDFEPIASELGIIFREVAGQGQIFDLIQFGKGSLDDYFADQKPFYQK
jgi:SseB protein C-terminal domain/SseB protein N-terminal domain